LVVTENPGKKILWAAENNLQDVVLELLAMDATLVNARDNDGYTPLHRASYNGHTDMVKVNNLLNYPHKY
jgi:ankyrin repeat protein